MVDKKKIAKNTIALYLRLGLTTIVSLYTARVVLETLGAADYGVYNVVGGVVGMLSFLNLAMSGATSRFLTYEMGAGSQQRVNNTFSTSVIIHLIIAALVLLCAETIGLWFVNVKLNLPPDSMVAVNWVFQFSILSSILSIVQVPYTAVIIAQERFSFYAYVEIVNVVLKLVIVYCLLVVAADKLILYAALSFIVSVIIWTVNVIYCLKNFPESHFRWIWDKSYFKPMLSFSGIDLFCSISVTANFQGLGIAMNLVYGAVINAAYGISNAVQGVLKGFSYSVISASRPQIIKSYAAGKLDDMNDLVFSSTNLALTLYCMLAVPMYLCAGELLKIWLGNVPAHTTAFLRITLLSCLFNLAVTVTSIPVHATGNIKSQSLTTGIISFITPFIFYFLMKIGMSVDNAFYIVFVSTMLIMIGNNIILKNLIPMFPIFDLYLKCYFPIIPVIIATYIVLGFIKIGNPFLLIVCVGIISVLIFGAYYIVWCLTPGQRSVLLQKILMIKKAHNNE